MWTGRPHWPVIHSARAAHRARCRRLRPMRVAGHQCQKRRCDGKPWQSGRRYSICARAGWREGLWHAWEREEWAQVNDRAGEVSRAPVRNASPEPVGPLTVTVCQRARTHIERARAHSRCPAVPGVPGTQRLSASNDFPGTVAPTDAHRFPIVPSCHRSSRLTVAAKHRNEGGARRGHALCIEIPASAPRIALLTSLYFKRARLDAVRVDQRQLGLAPGLSCMQSTMNSLRVCRFHLLFCSTAPIDDMVTSQKWVCIDCARPSGGYRTAQVAVSGGEKRKKARRQKEGRLIRGARHPSH